MHPRISIRGLVRPLVGWFVGRLVGRSVGNAFVKIDEKWTFTDSKLFRQCWTRKKEGRGGRRRGGRRDEEEGGKRRKDGRGGRSDVEGTAMRRGKKVVKKNEK